MYNLVKTVHTPHTYEWCRQPDDWYLLSGSYTANKPTCKTAAGRQIVFEHFADTVKGHLSVFCIYFTIVVQVHGALKVAFELFVVDLYVSVVTQGLETHESQTCSRTTFVRE